MQIIKTYEDVTRKYQHGAYGAYIDYDSHEFDGYVSGVSDEYKNTTVIFKVNAYQKYRITLNADTRFRVGTLPSYFWENGQPVNGTVVDNPYIQRTITTAPKSTRKSNMKFAYHMTQFI